MVIRRYFYIQDYVSDTEVITAVAPGPATITVSYTKGGISNTDTVEVTVEVELPYWN